MAEELLIPKLAKAVEMEFGHILAVEANRKEQTMSEDKAIHTLYERIGHLLCEQPYGELGRYLTYYAEDRLYLVFDLWYHGFFLVEAKSPKDAIEKVNCDQLTYLPKGEDDEV